MAHWNYDPDMMVDEDLLYGHPKPQPPTVTPDVTQKKPVGSVTATGGVRHSDPDTSREAAAKINTTKWERLVRDAVKALGTATNYEIAQHLGVEQVASISPRVKPLREKGLLRWNGEKRPGNSTRLQRVWECVPGTEQFDPATTTKKHNDIVIDDKEMDYV